MITTLLILLGLKLNMEWWYWTILIAKIVYEICTAAYKAGKES